MKFTVSSQRSLTIESKVKTESLLQGDMMTTLRQNFGEIQFSSQYGGYEIKVYPHLRDKGRFYFEPIAQLNHTSAKSFFGNMKKKPHMKFYVEI